MGTATSQTITKYYDHFKDISVTFTKEVIKATGLVTNQVYLKCVGQTWPCVIYAASFTGAKVIVNARSGLLDKIQKANNLVSLRWSFREAGKQDPIMFFVAAKAAGSVPHGNSPDFAMLTITYTQRPPDDLIEIVGHLLDANVNSARRKEERILLTPDSIRRLSLRAKETVAYIQGVPRKCILRDLSFSGAKLIMMGIPKYLLDRDVAIIFDFDDPRETIMIKGRTVRAEEVEGRKDLIALGLVFEQQGIPMNYKMRINDFLSQVRVDTRNQDNQQGTTEDNQSNEQ